jgi:DNA-binding NarL/FixJ family response regulator
MPSKPYRILVVDDHSIVRRGIRTLLSSQAGVEICGEATTGTEAMEHLKRDKPDMVLLDLTLPEMNGLQVAHAIREQAPDTAILILTMHFSDTIARDVLRSGALGYVLKSDADTELIAAIERVRNGKPFFTGKLAVSMAQTYADGPPQIPEEAAEECPLTGREVEVIQLLAEGKSNKQVAAALKVSTRTVESHRNHIMRKMKFSSFSELVRFAIRNNLVEL